MSSSRPSSAPVWPTHRARARQRNRTNVPGPIRINPKPPRLRINTADVTHI